MKKHSLAIFGMKINNKNIWLGVIVVDNKNNFGHEDMRTKVVDFKEGIDEATNIIKNGGVIACSTDTVYGLSCDPFCESAIDLIYELKNREKSVPLLLVAHKDYDISNLVVFDERSKMYTNKEWPGSVTFIFKIKDKRLKKLSCGKETIAIRKPNDKVFNLLLDKNPILTSTSANLSGMKVATNSDEVLKYFDGDISLVLDNGQSGEKSSTLVDLTSNKVKILRQGDVVVE